MTTSTQEIPTDYKPYTTVNFCGNHLEDVQYLINVNGFFPILIGKAIIPKIWLYAKRSLDETVTLIDRSISQTGGLSINIDFDNHEVQVIFDNKVVKMEVLTLRYSDDKITITKIDLQIANLYIFGDESRLQIGKETFVRGNSMTGVSTFIEIIN